MTDFSLRRRPRKYIDKKVILKDEDFRRRARWAINYAADVHSLTNETMAAAINVKIGTLANYRAMATTPKAAFIKAFCEKFNFNEVWFMRGHGEPFLGARSKYSEGGGPVDPAFAAPVEEPAHTYNKDIKAHGEATSTAPPPQFNIMEDLDLAARVLGSGTHYATALHLNIRSFSGAIASEATAATVISKCQEDLRTQGELIAHMQTRLDELERENKRLNKEMKALSDSSGGSAPIALGMDHAAPTGTDDPAA